jgi:hypothetical protein
MNTKHTPGPWHVGRVATTQGQHFAITSPNGDHIATIGEAINSHNGSGNAYVNARVIAAAPELLEALIRAEQALADIINAADNGQPYTAAELAENFLPDNDAAREAIAKAKATL